MKINIKHYDCTILYSLTHNHAVQKEETCRCTKRGLSSHWLWLHSTTYFNLRYVAPYCYL